MCHIPGFVEVTEVNTMNTVKRETASKFEGRLFFKCFLKVLRFNIQLSSQVINDKS